MGIIIGLDFGNEVSYDNIRSYSACFVAEIGCTKEVEREKSLCALVKYAGFHKPPHNKTGRN